MKQRKYCCLLLLFVALQVSSCKKFIEVDPPETSLNAGNVYTTDATAAAVLTEIYANMSDANGSFLFSADVPSLSLFAGLGADELSLFDANAGDLAPYYRNELNRTLTHNYWESHYRRVFAINSALEGLNASTSLTPAVKQQLLGEAHFMRAFCYFYLVNLYGEVPLVLNLDYKTNAVLSRASTALAYDQIITDLKKAQQLLSPEYLQADALTPYEAGSEERVRPTRWVATALLARTYLYTSDWTRADEEATKVIDHTVFFNLETLNSAFLKNNREAIWQLQPVGIDAEANTGEGSVFVLPMEGPSASLNPVYLSDFVLSDFEVDDQRKSNWVDSVVADGITYYFPYKYKVGNEIAPTSEYPTIFRLAELYLIRAEARAQLNDINGSQDDINIIRLRAGLSNTTAADPASLLNAIIQERRIELVTEWGHRWLDLKRIGKIDEVMTDVAPAKGGTWQPFQALYPIPEDELYRNPNMVQNPSY